MRFGQFLTLNHLKTLGRVQNCWAKRLVAADENGAAAAWNDLPSDGPLRRVFRFDPLAFK